ncbi:MAG: molybdenum cofactor guanylyltransferase [Chloroflexi bacterium]|nr:molybdenum cofactor guanylyltransferase [Chloroflexota bacterium]
MSDRPGGLPPVSGIVLAGGRSSRFGSDKLTATIGGTTLLDRAVNGVAAVAAEVVVVLAPGVERTLARTGDDRQVRFVADPEAFGGPLVGVLAGLEVVEQPLVIVAGGDMPDLNPDVLSLLVRSLATADASIGAVALRSRATTSPLPAAVRTGAATDVARRLVADGERRLRSLFDHLPTRVLEESEWRALDPDGGSLRDVDVPSDL